LCVLTFTIAILFGKVLRIESQAQVIFSDPIVIRFGSGVTDDDGRAADASDNEKKIPCPVLEFRIVNRLFNEVGGEIMDGKNTILCFFFCVVWCFLLSFSAPDFFGNYYNV
jgi:hypothetical protein